MLHVIGPSFGRTGTMSFKAALDELGFGPTYHMTEVYENDHVDAWTAAINGAPLEQALETQDEIVAALLRML